MDEAGIDIFGKTTNCELIDEVKNNGNGIPQKVLDRIFQPSLSSNLPAREQD